MAMDLETVKDMFKQFQELLKIKNLIFEEIKVDKIPLEKIVFNTEKLYYCYLFNIEESSKSDKVSLLYKQLVRVIEIYKKYTRGWIY